MGARDTLAALGAELRRRWLRRKLRRLQRRADELAARICDLWAKKRAHEAQEPARELTSLQVDLLLLRAQLGERVVRPRPASIGCKPLPIAQAAYRRAP